MKCVKCNNDMEFICIDTIQRKYEIYECSYCLNLEMILIKDGEVSK